jgi:threonine/homoserine/homoserine lactone efflux protein
MLSFLATGVLLGLSAGFAPGPLLALVVSETLRHDARAGIRVALAPVVTDVPIVLCSLFALVQLSRFHSLLGGISLAGSCFILYLGIQNLKTRGLDISRGPGPARSLQKGILVNLLSPHPYLFWFTVGGPMTIRAMQTGPAPAIFFIAGFYGLLVGVKIFLALLTARSRAFLKGKTYVLIMRLLGIMLILLALLLFKDGLLLLGVS